jgi:hypothetical protein
MKLISDKAVLAYHLQEIIPASRNLKGSNTETPALMALSECSLGTTLFS